MLPGKTELDANWKAKHTVVNTTFREIDVEAVEGDLHAQATRILTKKKCSF